MSTGNLTNEMKVVLPIEYWENEFRCNWKNGSYANNHFLKFLKNYKDQIGPKVLDLGSGDGRHLILLAQLGYNVTGLELTESGINNTRCRLKNRGLTAELIQASFHEIPYENESFETVISTQALHYNNWVGVLQSFSEISRVLRPRGLFFFRARSDKGAWRETDERIPDYGITRIETRGENKFVVMVHDFTLSEIAELADKKNFDVLGIPIDEDIDGKPGQWNVVFQKK
ncbi:MAG: class I SAM-dependent methyltransferase [Patescibacteria group bacterium]